MPAVKDTQRVSLVETAVDIGFTTAAVVLANIYLNRGTGAIFYNGQWQAVPLFSQEVLQYIPWLTAVWIADILVNIVLLVCGHWETTTRIATMATAAATGFIFYRMIVGGPMAAWAPVDPSVQDLSGHHLCLQLVGSGQAGLAVAAQQHVGWGDAALAACSVQVQRGHGRISGSLGPHSQLVKQTAGTSSAPAVAHAGVVRRKRRQATRQC